MDLVLLSCYETFPKALAFVSILLIVDISLADASGNSLPLLLWRETRAYVRGWICRKRLNYFPRYAHTL